MRTFIPFSASRRCCRREKLPQQPQHSHRLAAVFLAVALPCAVCWSGCPADRAWSAKMLSHESSQQLESKVRHARKAVVSCWAAGVFLATTAFTCPPALAASPTTQIKIRVETETLERALENKRGDINSAVSQLAQTVPSTSIRFIPPLNAPEPLVDVDQMFLDTWQDITSVFSSRQRAPNFLSQSFTVDLPAPGGTTQAVTLSSGPLLVAPALLSYPLAYAFYQYEQDQEVKAAEAKKAALKAKQADKQKTSKQKDEAKTAAKAKKGPKGSSSKVIPESPITVLKEDEIKAEAPIVPPVEKKKPSAPQIPNVTVSDSPVPAPLSSSPQEGGMDAYEQAYAAMMSASRVSLTSDLSKVKEAAPAQEESVKSSEPQKLAAPLPTPPAPPKSSPPSRQQEGGMDAYAQAYANMLSAPRESSTTYTAVSPEPVVEPKRAVPAVAFTTQSPEQQRRRGDDDDNGSMSAYEKAYAAMMQKSE